MTANFYQGFLKNPRSPYLPVWLKVPLPTLHIYMVFFLQKMTLADCAVGIVPNTCKKTGRKVPNMIMSPVIEFCVITLLYILNFL